MNYNSIIEDLIINENKYKTDKIIPLNNNKPIFSKADFEIIEGEPIYFEPDEYGRSNGGIALVSRNTMPLVIKKKLTYPNPYGWTKKLENKNLFERCHIIAYSLSARKTDRKNTFIGTSDLNTKTMMLIENRVKKQLKKHDVRILYRVTMKYKEDNQIPTGILIEAKSLDDSFCICEFCYNIQENVEFSYVDGTIISDNRPFKMVKKTINKILQLKQKKKQNKKENDNTTTDYVINRKNNEFHLYKSKCSKIQNVESKYLLETTTTKKDLEKADLVPCNKCII